MTEGVKDVPYLVHERDMARMQVSNRRMWILCIILAVLLAGSWIGFFIYESQFETVTQTQDVEQVAEDNGQNQFIGGDYYGDEAKDQDYDDTAR